MTVSIDVDINSRSAHVKLGALKAQIKDLEDNIDLDFSSSDLDLDLGDTIDDLSDAMDELSESFNSDLNDTLDRMEDIEFDHNLNRRQGSAGDTGRDSGDSITVDFDDSIKSLNNSLESFSESLGDDLDKKIDRMSDIEFDHNVDIKGEIGDKLQDDDDYIPSPRQFVKDSLFDDDPDNPQASSVRMFEKKAGILSDIFDVDQYTDDLKNRYKPYGDDDSGFTSVGKEVKKFHRHVGWDSLNPDEDSSLRTRFKDNDNLNPGGENEFATSRKKIQQASNFNTLDFKSGSMLRDDTDSPGINGVFPYIDREKKKEGVDFSREFKGLYRGLDKVTDNFKDAIPSMRTWFNLLAVAIPALAAVAVQALGVATAFGAIAVAGAAMVGLGLLGHGDSMAESFRNAKEEINELKGNLFEVFEPAADMFAGVQTRFFDAMPGMLEKVSRSLEGLLVFEDEFFDMFNQITKFFAGFVNMMAGNEDVISSLWDSFRGVLGTQVIKFFDWLLQAAYENQQMLVDLGGVLKTVALALYEVFVMISRTLIMLAPMFTAIASVASVLNNKLVSGMLATLAVMYLFTNVLPAIYLGFQALGFALQRSTIPSLAKAMQAMAAWMTQSLMAIGINGALAASIAAVSTALLTLMAISGIGLAISGLGILGMKALGPNVSGGAKSSGGFGGSGFGSGGGQTIINEGDTVNVDIGNADNSTIEKFSDMRGGGGDRGPTGGTYTSN